MDQDRSDDPFAGALVDWRGTARRVRRSAVVIGIVAGAAWVVIGALSGGPRLRDLGAYLFGAIAAMLVVEFVVVGGSALRGLLRAGERGERLAGGDVMLIPPQLRRKR